MRTGARSDSARRVTLAAARLAPSPQRSTGRSAPRRRETTTPTSGAGAACSGRVSSPRAAAGAARERGGLVLEQDRAGLARHRHVERLVDRVGGRTRVGDVDDRLHERPGDLVLRDPLEPWAPVLAPRRQGGDVDERDGVEPGLGEPGERIREAGPPDRREHAWPTGGTGMADCHERAGQLVRRHDRREPGASAEGVPELDRLGARDPEDVGRPATLERRAENVRRRRRHAQAVTRRAPAEPAR